MKFKASRTPVRIALFLLMLTSLLTYAPSANAASNFNVLNRDGKKIFSVRCDQFSYLRAGVYEVSNAHKYVKLLNKNGDTIPLILPADCRLHSIQFYGPEAAEPVQKIPDDALLEMSKISLYGLVSGDGKIILPFVYDNIESLGPETMLVRKFNRKTDLSENFFYNVRIRNLSKSPLTLETQYKFESDGLIGFTQSARSGRLPAWRSGYVNENNEVVIPPVYETVTPFRDGLAMVRLPNAGGRLELIDHKGKNPCPEIISHSIFLDGFAIASPVATPQLLGLVNRQFHFVVAPEYTAIIPLGKKLFAVKKHEGDSFDVISAEGKKLFTLPETVTKCDDKSYENPSLIITQVKAAEDEEIDRSGTRLAVFNRSGNLLLEFDGWVGDCKNGLTVLSKSDHINTLSGVIDANGRWLLPLRDSTFTFAGVDRIIEQTHINKFDSVAFKEGQFDEFAKFLVDFNLIGMPRQQVAALLGEQKPTQNTYTYSMMHSHCAEAWRNLEIEFAQNKVKRWRFTSSGGNGAYVETNVVFDPAAPISEQKLIKKL